MGYCHYFKHKKTYEQKWEAIVIDCFKMYLHLPETIEHKYRGNPYNNLALRIVTSHKRLTPPIINMKEISFNGYGILGCEQFTLRKDPYPVAERSIPSFCTTQRMPYDLFVCICLIVYKHHAPNHIDITSNGEASDWQLAIDLVNKVFKWDVVFEDIITEE